MNGYKTLAVYFDLFSSLFWPELAQKSEMKWLAGTPESRWDAKGCAHWLDGSCREETCPRVSGLHQWCFPMVGKVFSAQKMKVIFIETKRISNQLHGK